MGSQKALLSPKVETSTGKEDYGPRWKGTATGLPPETPSIQFRAREHESKQEGIPASRYGCESAALTDTLQLARISLHPLCVLEAPGTLFGWQLEKQKDV